MTPNGYHLQIRINKSLETNSFQIWMVYRTEDGTVFVAEPTQFGAVHQGVERPPLISIPLDDRKALQDFANELASIGIVADQAADIQGELKAVRYHLEDMRAQSGRLLSHVLKLPKGRVHK